MVVGTSERKKRRKIFIRKNRRSSKITVAYIEGYQPRACTCGCLSIFPHHKRANSRFHGMDGRVPRRRHRRCSFFANLTRDCEEKTHYTQRGSIITLYYEVAIKIDKESFLRRVFYEKYCSTHG